MFVYSKKGIWRSLDENKQYSTPVWYGVSAERTKYTPIQVMQVFVVLSSKIAKFFL